MATNPGMHGSVRFDVLSNKTQEIIQKLASCFYVTKADRFSDGGSEYEYAFVRPATSIEHSLPNAREFIVLFSDYENFEARTLSAYSKISSQLEDELRINGNFRILVSSDNKIKNKLNKVFNEEPDIPVTLVFRYEDLMHGIIADKIVNEARNVYHFRDLFSQREPLKGDAFFFGRSSLLSSLRDRMSRGECSGVFGLRKSGKTSILLACERLSKVDNHRFVHIDCQSPSITSLKWNDALLSISKLVRQKAGLSNSAMQLGSFDVQNAADSFEKAINDSYSAGRKITVLAFDEVEHISPVTGVGHWRDGEDALKLWQAIRSAHQKFSSKFCFIIAGTNPSITEHRQISGTDNPILQYVEVFYLPGLTDQDVLTMCQTLGELMGMRFDITSINDLYKALGGHAFLTRQVASKIHNMISFEGRPLNISSYDVSNAINEMNFKTLFDDILVSLRDRYRDEYDLLEWSAVGDTDVVTEFLKNDPNMVDHLCGYGIVEKRDNIIYPKMGLVTDYLRSSSKVSGVVRDQADRWSVIARKRGLLEVELRKVVRHRALDKYGKREAVKYIFENISKVRLEKIGSLSTDQIFSDSDCPLYFSDLMSVFKSEKEYWGNRFSMSYSDLNGALDKINKLRADAHAKSISDHDFDEVLGLIDSLMDEL